MPYPNQYTDLAARFARYGDILTGFGVAQTMVYLFALGKETGFSDKVIYWQTAINWGVIGSGILYQIIIFLLASFEFKLRKKGCQDPMVYKLSASVYFARALILVSSTFLCYATTCKIAEKYRDLTKLSF